MVRKHCLVYILYICVYLIILVWFLFLKWRIYTIDSCWYRQLIALTQAQYTRLFAVRCSLNDVFNTAFRSRRCCQCKATTLSAFVAASSLKSAWCVPALRNTQEPVPCHSQDQTCLKTETQFCWMKLTLYTRKYIKNISKPATSWNFNFKKVWQHSICSNGKQHINWSVLAGAWRAGHAWWQLGWFQSPWA